MCDRRREKSKALWSTRTHTHRRARSLAGQPTDRPHKLLSATSSACRKWKEKNGFYIESMRAVRLHAVASNRGVLRTICMMAGILGSWHKLYYCITSLLWASRLTERTTHQFWVSSRRGTRQPLKDWERGERERYEKKLFILCIIIIISRAQRNSSPSTLRRVWYVAHGPDVLWACEHIFMSYEWWFPLNYLYDALM